ncbi:efflux RND transporter periplasmic adaptor subunit [Ferrimonas gelatinilytica]|uniref:Efflux RND transporter periplasmic adaptor subunit n=1 Tax=Ferrimonas gelatinilytica TaxID=1255257 RepID=A0ABP9RY93_9GAMM
MDLHRGLIITLLITPLLACGQQSNAADEAKAAPLVPVETGAVSRESVSHYYRTTALLEAPEEAKVVARIDGIIETLAVEEGDRVQAGQLLATLDPRHHRLHLNKAQAELDVIDQELNRLAAIANRQLVSEETIAKLQYRREAALAQRDLAQLQWQYSQITAPIDGVIAKRHAKVGNMAKVQEVLFEVVQQHPLHAVVHLPEQELGRVRLQQEARLSLQGVDGPVPAQVLRIAPTVDPDTGTAKITLLVNNEARHLKAGMFSNVQLRFDTHENALVLPRIALIRQDLGHAVFVIKEGMAERREVTLGYSEGEQVEVVAGLTEGDQVVVRGHHQLHDGTEVTVIDPLQLAAGR